MFEFFGSNKNHFIGVDFGTSSIKVVELSYENQTAILENYGVVDLSFSEYSEQHSGAVKNVSYEKKMNDLLKKMVEKMNLKPGVKTHVSIPGFLGLITIIDLPEMQSDELTKAIQFEAHKYIPSSLDEIAMSWEVLFKDGVGENLAEQKKIGEKRIKVLLVAAPKRDIERYDRLVSDTKLKVEAIELETFSIVRSLVGDDLGTFLIIDIGYRATNIILVEKGVVISNRNIDAGGNEITSALSESMNISKQRAEAFKRGEKDFLNSKESAFVVPVLDFITSESNRLLAAFKEKKPGVRIDGIILSGGTSKMIGIKEYFSNALGSEVRIGNPWQKIRVPEKASILVKDLGSSFAVALGLALRGVEDYKRE